MKLIENMTEMIKDHDIPPVVLGVAIKPTVFYIVGGYATAAIGSLIVKFAIE